MSFLDITNHLRNVCFKWKAKEQVPFCGVDIDVARIANSCLPVWYASAIDIKRLLPSAFSPGFPLKHGSN